MINTRLYKSIYSLAEQLLEADNRGNQEQFDSLYSQLKAICYDNEGSEIDHPEQWETLADFTADFDEALALYDKALQKATDLYVKDYLSSIGYSKAQLLHQLGRTDEAIESLKQAKVSANKIEDKALKSEIDELLNELMTS